MTINMTMNPGIDDRSYQKSYSHCQSLVAYSSIRTLLVFDGILSSVYSSEAGSLYMAIS
jgi:hypothetical protein